MSTPLMHRAPDAGRQVADLIAGLPTLDLATLNERAAMLERLDNKYVVGVADLQRLIPALADHFDVLNIDGVRQFRYDTCYVDDAERRSYLDHLHGRRRRFKARFRRYPDSGQCFFEIKLRSIRGRTIKSRLARSWQQWGRFDDEASRFTHAAGIDAGDLATQALHPVLAMRYRRSTLVARSGGERLTIDTGLIAGNDAQAAAIDPRLAIIETKSRHGRGLADRILRDLQLRPLAGCSKYCTAMAALGMTAAAHRFLPALRRLAFQPAALAMLPSHGAVMTG